MQSLDMATTELREVNATLQAQTPASNLTEWVIDNPRGAHAVAVGLDTPISVTVRGSVKSLGADCVEKEMRAEHLDLLADLLARAGVDAEPAQFRRYGSARRLYHFNIDHADQY
jgi:hypothetical protein